MKIKLYVLAGSALLSTAVAFASSPSAATSTATAPSKILEKISLGYFGLFNGPAVNSFGMNTPDSDGGIYKKVNMEHYVGLGYKVTPKTTVGVTQGVVQYLAGGQDYAMKDPVIKVSNPAVIEKGSFSAGGDVRYYVPATPGSKKADIGGAFRVSESLSYEITGSRWTAGLDMFQRYWLIGAKTPTDQWMDLELCFNPMVSYQLNPKLSFDFGAYKEYIHGAYDVDGVLNLSSLDKVSVSGGVSWKPIKNVTFSPGISYYPEKASLDSTTVGFTLLAKIL